MQQDFNPTLSAHWLRSWLAKASNNRPVLIGVSGGIDSMVLWHLVHESGHPYGVAHVNYHLRDEDSKLDEALVFRTAHQRGVLLDVLQNSTLIGGSNIQARARAIRLDFFDQCRKARGYTATLLGHHADDQLETLFISLARGAGPNALAGMREIDTAVLRPLLSFSKQEITAFAKTHGIEHREDRSNESDAYLRNKIRHHLVPPLKEVSPGILENVGRTLQEQQQLIDFATRQVEQLKSSCSLAGFPNYLDRDALAKLAGLGYAVHQLLKPYNFGSRECIDITNRISSGNRAKASFENLDRSVVCIVAGKAVWCQLKVNFPATKVDLLTPGTYASKAGRLELSEDSRALNLPEIEVETLENLSWRSISAAEFKEKQADHSNRFVSAFAKTNHKTALKGNWLTGIYQRDKLVWLLVVGQTEVLAKAKNGQTWKIKCVPSCSPLGAFIP